MNYNKTELIRIFENAGFVFIKQSHTFAKKVMVDGVPLYITMIVNKHRFYCSRYTMEMYIAPHARCCLGGKGEPFEFSFRSGNYISEDERLELCAVDHESQDVWWDLSREEELKEMAEKTILAADRVICDPTRMRVVLDSLITSDSVRNDLKEAEDISRIVRGMENDDKKVRQHCLPAAWCLATEQFLVHKYNGLGSNRLPSRYWIYLYATDAYLQHIL